MTALGNALVRRSAALCPRWPEPLSTLQSTCLALAQGSVLMTWATRFMNGSMPVLGAVRSNTRASWTS
ncbi:hypothetical protein SRB17_84050 [Streptomyces sp. RB17]|nr:hypothetical protein [Streptomyces sp. RB17]